MNQFWFVSSETMFSQTTWCVFAPSLAWRGSGAVLFADGDFLGVGAGLDFSSRKAFRTSEKSVRKLSQLTWPFEWQHSHTPV